MASDFDELYQFIPGDDRDDTYRPTTRDQLAKARGFKDAMAEARDVIIAELAVVERSILVPGRDARRHLEIYRKRIKGREDRKVRWAEACMTDADGVSLTGNGTRVELRPLNGRAASLKERRGLG
jgi:hypothetical protein